MVLARKRTETTVKLFGKPSPPRNKCLSMKRQGLQNCNLKTQVGTHYNRDKKEQREALFLGNMYEYLLGLPRITSEPPQH